MFDGYRIIFWGIFFITFHINLGPIAILPAFVGYMIVSSGINHLQEEFASPYFQKARNISTLLTILGVISFVLIWVLQQQSIAMSYYPLLFSILELFLVYFILEGSIEKFIFMDRKDIARDYRSEQRTYTVFMTIYIIGMCIAITLVETSFALAMILIGVFLRLWLMLMLGRLKRAQYEKPGKDFNSPDENNIVDEVDSQKHFDEIV
jgi:hypothetical protein